MKQEHRLVAEVYRWLAPFVGATQDVYLSPDGQAAKTAVAAGRFVDSDIPDLPGAGLSCSHLERPHHEAHVVPAL